MIHTFEASHNLVDTDPQPGILNININVWRDTFYPFACLITRLVSTLTNVKLWIRWSEMKLTPLCCQMTDMEFLWARVFSHAAYHHRAMSANQSTPLWWTDQSEIKHLTLLLFNQLIVTDNYWIQPFNSYSLFHFQWCLTTFHKIKIFCILGHLRCGRRIQCNPFMHPARVNIRLDLE